MNKLKELRTRYGMKQKDVAEKLGTTQQTIGRWETGHTPIPAGHLKDLAVLFGCSVDELLGVERRGDERIRPEFAEADHDIPFGTARFVFGFGKREYPIDERAQRFLLRVTGEYVGLNETKGWLEFATLNNKLVFVNPDTIRQFALISDNVEEMPEIHHPEVCLALDDEDVEIGPEVKRYVDALRETLGPDGVIRFVSQTEVVYHDGRSEHLLLDDEGATGVHALSVHNTSVPRNAFVVLSGEDEEEKTFVNLSQVAVLEVPLERYLRLIEV